MLLWLLIETEERDVAGRWIELEIQRAIEPIRETIYSTLPIYVFEYLSCHFVIF